MSTKLDRHLAEQAENEAVHQNNPPTRSTLASLAFADHMDRLVAGDRTPSSPKRAKMLAGVNPALDRPVTLFKDIVEVLHRSMSAVPLQRDLVQSLNLGPIWRASDSLSPRAPGSARRPFLKFAPEPGISGSISRRWTHTLEVVPGGIISLGKKAATPLKKIDISKIERNR